ncbi:MAG: phosphatase PAP2 family protein [Pseudomonadota bacterium]
MRKVHPSLAWHRQLAGALAQHFWLKALLTPLFIALFFGAYLYLLKSPTHPPTVMPLTALDHWISFQPAAISLYLSLWVYVSLPSALLGTQRELFDYGAAMAANCLIGLLIFYVWPSAVPPVLIDWALYPGMDYLKNMDAAGNACPSLHVATATFSALWLNCILNRCGAPRGMLCFNWVWCAGIIYSTVAIRQHVVVDVIAGMGLGMLVAYLSLRPRNCV